MVLSGGRIVEEDPPKLLKTSDHGDVEKAERHSFLYDPRGVCHVCAKC